MRRRSEVYTVTSGLGSQVLADDGQPGCCGVCGLLQSMSSSGPTCSNGHGGAVTITAAEGAMQRELYAPEIVATADSVAATQAPPGTTKVRRGKRVKEPPPAEVQKTSEELQKAIDEEAEAEARAAASPTDWGSNGVAYQPLDPAFERIIEKLVVDDPTAAYERLEKGLRVGEGHTEYGAMMRALDEAETNARTAHRLWQAAIVERSRWERENAAVFAGMRTQANRSLQHEKESGLRTKMITDADVESRVAALFPDQWREQEMRRVRVKSMVDSMGNLTEMWGSRCRSLQTLLTKQR